MLYQENKMLTSSEDGTIRIWHTGEKNGNSQEIHVCEAHKMSVTCLEINQKGLVLTCGGDSLLKMWKIEGNKLSLKSEWNSRGSIPTCVAMKDERTIFYGSSNGFVCRVELEENWKIKEEKSVNALNEDVTCMAYKEGKLYCGHRRGSLSVYNEEDLQLERQLEMHEKEVTCIQAEKGSLFTGSLDGTVKESDLETLNNKRIFERLGMLVYCLHVKDDLLLVGADEEVLRVWNLKKL